MAEYLLGLDVGTTNTKAILINGEGEEAARAERKHEVQFSSGGRVEQDAEKVWWAEFISIARELLDSSGISPADIAGIGISSMGANLTAIDENGSALRPGILYGVDTRANKEIDYMNETAGPQKILEVGAMALSSQSVGPKILWIKNNEPEVYRRTRSFLTTNGFIVRKLTGRNCMDSSSAAFYGPFYDYRLNRWDEGMCGLFGVEREKLPEMVDAHEVIGEVTAEAAAECGLKAGTPVIAGSIDTYAEAVGGGAVEPGEVFTVYGSTMSMLANAEKITPEPVLWTTPHYPPELFTLIGSMSTSGNLITWFFDRIAEPDQSDSGRFGEVLEQYNREAEKIAPGSEGLMVLPYFSGERTPINDPHARGVVAGLTLSHNRYHIYRALLEAIAFGFKHHLDLFTERNINVTRIISSGGGVKNRLWAQIISDVSGFPQKCVDTGGYTAPLGNCIMAGYAVGLFDVSRAKEDFPFRLTREIRPDMKKKDEYDKLFPLYRDLYLDTADTVHNLARL
jgi:xylulokinase